MTGPPYFIWIRGQRLSVAGPLPEKSHVKLRVHGLLDGVKERRGPGGVELAHNLVVLDVDEIEVSTPPEPEHEPEHLDQAEPAPVPSGEPCLSTGCTGHQSEDSALCPRCFERAKPHEKRAAVALRRAAPGYLIPQLQG